MNKQEFKAAGLLAEFAKVFHNTKSARLVLENIGFPMEIMPSMEKPEYFWEEVTSLIDQGKNPGDLQVLVDEAHRQFPRNQLFGGNRNTILAKKEECFVSITDFASNESEVIPILNQTLSEFEGVELNIISSNSNAMTFKLASSRPFQLIEFVRSTQSQIKKGGNNAKVSIRQNNSIGTEYGKVEVRFHEKHVVFDKVETSNLTSDFMVDVINTIIRGNT